MNLPNHPVCADQNQALNSYLDALLSTPPEMSSPSPAVAAPALATPPPRLLAGGGLKCFVFMVAGLKLALPLARVTEIVDFAGCKGVAVPPLVLGSLAYDGRNVPVLDSARILLPDRQVTPSYQWLVIVDHGSYALACDAVDPNIEVAHEAVRWRSHLTKRRWLAGTLLQHRCALLDADEVYEPAADNPA